MIERDKNHGGLITVTLLQVAKSHRITILGNKQKLKMKYIANA